MACVLTQDIPLGCRDAVGGIKTIFVTELANKASITTAAGVITAFTLATGKQFWQYDVAKEVANFKENIKPGDGLHYEQAVSLKLRKRSSVLNEELKLVAQNYLLMIALDRNGDYWLLGEENGVELMDSDFDSGTAMGDFNGYNLNFSGKEKLPASKVTASLMATLIAPAV